MAPVVEVRVSWVREGSARVEEVCAVVEGRRRRRPVRS